MQDDIIKKVFETAYIQVQSEISDLEKSIGQKYDSLKEREQAITDLASFTTEMLRKILLATANLEADKKAQAFEAGLNSLIIKLKEITQKSHDETLRASGASSAISSVMTILSKGYAIHEQELEKALAIQENHESGVLDQKRKIGSRPEKLKDVRNYTPADKCE